MSSIDIRTGIQIQNLLHLHITYVSHKRGDTLSFRLVVFKLSNYFPCIFNAYKNIMYKNPFFFKCNNHVKYVVHFYVKTSPCFDNHKPYAFILFVKIISNTRMKNQYHFLCFHVLQIPLLKSHPIRMGL